MAATAHWKRLLSYLDEPRDSTLRPRQMQPHTPTRFVQVDMATALEARHDRRRRIEHLRNTLA